MTESTDRAILGPKFLSGLTHELRTPLGSILMLTELLGSNRSGNLNAKDREYIDKIGQAASDVRALIEDVGQLNRIVAGRVIPRIQPVSLRDLVSELNSADDLAASPAQLTVHWDAEVPEEIETDRGLLKRLLELLIADVSQSSGDQRGVEMTLGRASSGSSEPGEAVVIKLHDQGPTVPTDQRLAVFEPFGALGSRGGRRLGGHSLTLPLAAQLACLLGGELGFVEGEEARAIDAQAGGNTLSLTLPLASKEIVDV